MDTSSIFLVMTSSSGSSSLNFKMIRKCFIPLNVDQSNSSHSSCPSVSSHFAPEVQRETNVSSPSHVDNDLELGLLNADPSERKPISEYSCNIQDKVGRYYIQKGACQPIGHAFPQTQFGKKKCGFVANWLKGLFSMWLEYSIKADAAFCLYCYLFKNELESHGNDEDAFTIKGFRSWNKCSERLNVHVGDANSIHNKCFNQMLDFQNQRQSIRSSFVKQSEQAKHDYQLHLNASIDVGTTSTTPSRQVGRVA